MKWIYFTILINLLWVNSLQEIHNKNVVQQINKLRQILDKYQHERERRTVENLVEADDEDIDEYEDKKGAVLHRGKRSPRFGSGGSRNKKKKNSKLITFEKRTGYVKDTHSSGGSSSKVNKKKKSSSSLLYGKLEKQLLCTVFVVTLAVIYR